MSQPIFPCLWFNGKAKEAADFYVSVFKESKITTVTPLVVLFELNGKKFMALNGGPNFLFNEAISFVIECQTQEEIDHYWENLSRGGKEMNCGWVKDQFGISWQIVPIILGKLMSDPEKAPKVYQSFQTMKKFIISDLLKA